MSSRLVTTEKSAGATQTAEKGRSTSTRSHPRASGVNPNHVSTREGSRAMPRHQPAKVESLASASVSQVLLPDLPPKEGSIAKMTSEKGWQGSPPHSVPSASIVHCTGASFQSHSQASRGHPCPSDPRAVGTNRPRAHGSLIHASPLPSVSGTWLPSHRASLYPVLLCFLSLVHAVGVQCEERGRLLARVWNHVLGELAGDVQKLEAAVVKLSGEKAQLKG